MAESTESSGKYCYALRIYIDKKLVREMRSMRPFLAIGKHEFISGAQLANGVNADVRFNVYDVVHEFSGEGDDLLQTTHIYTTSGKS
jgi:hypothetical protein